MVAPIDATKEDFWDLVGSGTVLVDVWGPSCRPCMALMPFVKQLAEDRADVLRVVKLEAPKARRLCMELQLMGLPAFVLFVNGVEASRIGGNDLTQERLTAWLDDELGALERR